MNINVKIKNSAKLRRSMARAPGYIRREMANAINRAILVIGREATGQVTTGPNRAIDTGRLRASIMGRGVRPASEINLTASVGPTVDYAIYVHEGTRYMRPRPFLASAMESKEREVKQLLEDGYAAVLRRVAREGSS